jgi:hypothetical protein
MSRHKSSLHALAILAASASLACFGADALNASQLKAMYSGKTFEATSQVNNVSFTNYFSPDGRVAQVSEKGDKKSGSWRVDESGKHCVHWDGDKEFCHTVVPQGDGTYKRYAGDKHVVTIHKVTDGNPLKLVP